jgi:hypothetical protein
MWLLVSTALQVTDASGAKVRLNLRPWSGASAIWAAQTFAGTNQPFATCTSQVLVPFFAALGFYTMDWSLDVTDWGGAEDQVDYFNLLLKVDGWIEAGQ